MKSIVISSRQRSSNRAGVPKGMAFTIRGPRLADVSHRVNLMKTPTELKITTLPPETLLGPLNDVEEKYAPPKLFAAGPMELPLPRPRVAIIGSRKASAKGL